MCVLPVICVVVSVARRGVNVISNQPVEVLVATDTDALHVLLGDVQAVCVEVAQDHHVLEQRGGRTSTGATCSTGAQCEPTLICFFNVGLLDDRHY